MQINLVVFELTFLHHHFTWDCDLYWDVVLAQVFLRQNWSWAAGDGKLGIKFAWPKVN